MLRFWLKRTRNAPALLAAKGEVPLCGTNRSATECEGKRRLYVGDLYRTIVSRWRQGVLRSQPVESRTRAALRGSI